jgi:hypothetical protein
VVRRASDFITAWRWPRPSASQQIPLAGAFLDHSTPTFLEGGRVPGSPMATIVPAQCWMARTALGWGVRDLARAAEVSPDTVMRFERGDELKAATVEMIQRTLEEAGVIFINANQGGPGVRLRSQDTERER